MGYGMVGRKGRRRRGILKNEECVAGSGGIVSSICEVWVCIWLFFWEGMFLL